MAADPITAAAGGNLSPTAPGLTQAAAGGNVSPTAPGLTQAASGGNVGPTAPAALTAASGGDQEPDAPSAETDAWSAVAQEMIVTGTLTKDGSIPVVFAPLTRSGSYNGRPFYTGTNANLLWDSDNGRWQLIFWNSGLPLATFFAQDNVATPDLTASWVADNPATGTPVVTASGPEAPAFTAAAGGNLAPTAPGLTQAAAGGNVSPTAPAALTAAAGGNLSPTAPGAIA